MDARRPTITVAVLGTVSVAVDDQIVPVRGELKHRLLARLALTPYVAVPVDGLIEALWGEDPPRTAKQSVHVHISHLRDRLRPHGAHELITTTSDGSYLLGVDESAIDACVFESRVDQGAAAQRAGNARHARDVLGDALASWGEPYSCLANHPAAIAERQRLAALHERASDDLAQALIDLGELDRAVPLLRAAVAASPLRERPYEQLIGAYRSQGERGRAVEVYEQARQTLRSSLGIEPSPQLAEVAFGEQTPAQSTTAATAGQPMSAAIGALDIATHSLVHVGQDADVRNLVGEITADANAVDRRVAHARIQSGAVSPLSPIIELSGLRPDDPSLRRVSQRRELFRRINDGLIANYSSGLVLLVEHVDQAPPLLVDFLVAALSRSGPAPFTFVGLHAGSVSSEADAGEPVRRLSSLCEQVSLELPSLARIEDLRSLVTSHEEAIMHVLCCTILPAPIEVVARASGLSAQDAAEAVQHLVLRNVVTRETGERLGVRSLEAAREQFLVDARNVGLHERIVQAISRSAITADSYRLLADAHHRLRALPEGDRDRAWQAALAAARYLEQTNAFQDLVDMLAAAPFDDQHEWSATTLDLLVRLGRSQIRSGLSVKGQETLERAIVVAQQLDRPQLFAEAVRALAEERAPQRSTVQMQSLLTEALGNELASADTRVQLMTDLANSWYFADPDRASQLADQALTTARSASPETIARALTGHVQANLRPGNAAQRIETALEAQRFARQADSTESLVLALTYEAGALMELGQLRRADPPLRYAEALAADVQVPRFQWWAAAWRSLLDFALGDLDQAEERFQAAYALWPSSTRADPFECLSAQFGCLRLAQGRGDELLPVLDRLVGDDAQLAYLAPAALAFAQHGDQTQARGLVEKLVSEPYLLSCRDITLPFALAITAEAAHLVGAESVSGALVQMLHPLVETHAVLNVWGGGGFYWGSLRHAYGLALDLSGAAEQARVELDLAARSNADAGAKFFAGRATECR